MCGAPCHIDDRDNDVDDDGDSDKDLPSFQSFQASIDKIIMKNHYLYIRLFSKLIID